MATEKQSNCSNPLRDGGEAGLAFRINGPAAEDCGDLLSDSFHVQTHSQSGQPRHSLSHSYESTVVYDTFVCLMTEII